MKSTDILRQSKRDHAFMDSQIEDFQEALLNLRFEGKGSLGKNLRRAQANLSFFREELLWHMRLEEKVLFPYLEKCLPKLESIICLLKLEHDSLRKTMDQIRDLIKKLLTHPTRETAPVKIETLRETGIYWIYLLRSHVEVENESIYKTMSRSLRPNEKNELAKKIHDFKTR